MGKLLEQFERGELPPIHNLVALMGERRRGKDFLTSGLIETFGAKRISFSDEVRDLSQKIFPWFNAYMKDEDKEKLYKHPYNTENKTGRDIILMAGKVREVDGMYFVRNFIENQFTSVLLNPNQLHVITDFRTVDEYEGFIKPLKIPVIKIYKEVDLEPHPFEQFVRDFKCANAGFYNNVEGVDYFINFFEKFCYENGVTFVKT